ncbi:hypothetical protein C7212DRAFT_284283 [Tuber magnatum]|uniref:Uncharacterized protein n=1 Tax=Tuber magnatum TaxID=42249 RepID=A0A317SLR0_9PEZI|nr:hypothetical protein C7212DRAFT_284283 [Tuber magnatum]
MQQERDWVQRRYIVKGYRGKGSRVWSMLEDEGTLLAVRKYISSVSILGKAISAQDLVDAVTTHWEKVISDDPEQNTDDHVETIQYMEETLLALHELDNEPKEWSLSAHSAVNWLQELGYEWREVKKGLFKDGHE